MQPKGNADDPHLDTQSMGKRLTGPVRVALIGGGRISEQHLRALVRREDVEVVGICDLSEVTARFAAERFGIPAVYTEHERMLDATGPDVVHVLTPAGTHARLVKDCLSCGAHVLVEKPVALSRMEFRDLWDLAGLNGRRLIENQNYRFNGVVRRLDRFVRDGRLGRVEEVRVRMALGIRGGRYADENLPHPSHRLPCGVIHEFISHLCYLLLQFLPAEEPEIVRALWRNRGGGNLFRLDDLDALIAAGSATGSIRFTGTQWPEEFSIEVRGSMGWARAEIFQPSWQAGVPRRVGRHLTPVVNSLALARDAVRAGVSGIWRRLANLTPYEGLDALVDLIYDSLREGTEPPVGFQEMDNTMRLIDALVPAGDSR